MVYHLLLPLSEHIGSFRAFESISFRVICAALTAFLVCFVVGPGIIERLRSLRLNENIRSGSDALAQMQIAAGKGGTPTMGGMILVLATVVGTLMFARLDVTLVQAALWTTVAMGVLGGMDDRIKLIGAPDPRNPGKRRRGMNGWPKIVGQALIGAVAVTWLWSSMRTVAGWAEFRAFGLELPLPAFGPLFVAAGILVLVATSNAVNLADGMDGLAAGCGTIVLLVMSVLAYLVGRTDMAAHLGAPFIPGGGELAVFLAALAGATGGFLWWNAHPARVFMGNTGSMALGGGLAVAAVGIRQEIVLLIAGAAFVWEALSVILQVASFKTTGRRIFRIAPFHHHLQFLGWSESRVVLAFWAGSAAFGVLALGLTRVL